MLVQIELQAQNSRKSEPYLIVDLIELRRISVSAYQRIRASIMYLLDWANS